MKKVAVLMSTYNGEQFIREQIDSILNQQGEYIIDLWIRDDGSTDSTQDILDEYASKNKLRWYTGKNLGPTHSFLDLVKHCAGYEFYAFSDQDDYWMPDKISSGIQKIENYKEPALYCSNAKLVDHNLKTLDRNVYKQLPKLDFYTLSCAGGLLGCTMIFNKELAQIIQNNEIPKGIVLHDFYTALLCSMVGGTLIYDEEPRMMYRQHENNVVGVSYGLLGTIYDRINDIMKKPKISIAEQATDILKLKNVQIIDEKRKWLEMISEYRDTCLKRFFLSTSVKTRYINFNMGLKLRISIFLGHR